MPKQERISKDKTARKQDEQVEAEETASSKKAEELKDEMDDILDEIDSVLEANAEEFVKAYVQKGGE